MNKEASFVSHCAVMSRRLVYHWAQTLDRRVTLSARNERKHLESFLASRVIITVIEASLLLNNYTEMIDITMTDFVERRKLAARATHAC